MRRIALALASAALLAGGASAVSAKPKLTPQERLDKMLDGREPGKPVSCISTYDSRDMTVLDKVGIVFRSGGTLYVNRPENIDQLDSDDIMVTRTFGSQLCRLDIVHTVDRSGHFPTGFINLGDFVPYKKAPKVATAN
ncbi:hypothetical protein [Novosphingobium sp.]|uniref:hypothetical protein n=1 Tax=Novosphingobium sp. TaxID=1874826 RepID=UPI0027342D22|nr:hypothetical protein [Novosphingobium sp.]MDP3906121.1 hypothetical protein [Novosphingobium sp.]